MAKIINESCWRTEDLRVFVSRVLPIEIEDAAKRKKIVITFVNARSRGVSGNAYVRGTRCRIRLPRPVNMNRRFLDNPALAMVLAHEFAHLRGYEGGRSNELALRGSAKYGYRGDYKTFYAWANDLELREKETKSKQAASVQDKTELEIVKIEAAMARWQSKLRRCETALKKYRQKLAYRQKKLAAINGGHHNE